MNHLVQNMKGPACNGFVNLEINILESSSDSSSDEPAAKSRKRKAVEGNAIFLISVNIPICNWTPELLNFSRRLALYG